MVGTSFGWDSAPRPAVLNESPDCDTNDVFGEHLTTAFTDATGIIDARFASEISQKNNFLTAKVDPSLRVSNWAGMLVTRRITVRASTRMMQYVWLNVPDLLPIFCQVEKNDGVTKWLAPEGLVGTHVAG